MMINLINGAIFSPVWVPLTPTILQLINLSGDQTVREKRTQVFGKFTHPEGSFPVNFSILESHVVL